MGLPEGFGPVTFQRFNPRRDFRPGFLGRQKIDPIVEIVIINRMWFLHRLFDH
ncbi:hypothetical protein L828_2956 [Mycobacteroides abscessus MAB_030201_1061]|nr:hypothetical protein L828_2956 [Mycobacteroides abscessus MAB_030201_1061]